MPQEFQYVHPPNEWITRKCDLMHAYTVNIQASIANAHRPYLGATTLPHPHLPFDQCLYSGEDEQLRFEYANHVAQHRLLTVSFALRAYYLEHGTYPATLAALMPVYLAAVPDDPFAATGSMQYLRKGTGYLLYSIGPNGTNNGGTPCKNPRVARGDTGDIVAEVNQ